MVISTHLNAQNGSWTWMTGSSPTQTVAVDFGTKGVPAATNHPGVAYATPHWTDLNGNFWILGAGQGLDQNGIPFNYDAMWKYDVATGLWVWMSGPTPLAAPGVSIYGVQGVPSPQNFPANGGASNHVHIWTDLQGNLWLFGAGQDAIGSANMNGAPNDLWKYDIITNEWTWMHGSNLSGMLPNYGSLQVPSPTNLPPAPWESGARWVDNSGNLWMYGSEYDAMWKFDISINQWTWMSGQSQGGTISANYGVKGVAAPSNTPGTRTIFTNFKDECGNFWFYDAYANSSTWWAYTREMWMYNPTTFLWTWMAGDTFATSDYDPAFNQKCVPTDSLPGAYSWECRQAWTDNDFRFWMFSTNAGTSAELSMFDPNTLKYTWVSGPLTSSNGVFGTQGVPSTANRAPSMLGACVFKGLNGDLWLYGPYENPVTFVENSTLWRYQIDPNCPLSSSAILSLQSDSVGCSPYTAQFITYSTAAIYHWDFGDASTLADTSNQDTVSWTFNQAGDYLVTLITSVNCDVDTTSVNIRISNPPVLDLGADTSICPGQLLALTTTIPGSYIWNTGDTTASILVNTAGQYSIQITTDTFNCVVNDTVNIALAPLPTPNLGIDTALCTGQTILLNPGTFDSYQWNTGDTTATLTANAEGNYSVQVELNKCFNSDTVFIQVDEEPTIGVATDSVRCNIVLDAGNPGASYQWSTGETTQTITAMQTGTYSVTITNGACVVVDSITITRELGGGLLYIPNAFTPDQNGLNEKFQPVGTNIVDFSMAIYNRWGELVYATNDITKGWDGRRNGNLVQQDVYVYSINYSSDCLDGKRVRKMGQVMVLR